MTQEQINLLIEKYLTGKATASEKAELMNWYRSVSETEMEIWMKDETEKETLKQQILQELKQRIANSQEQQPVTKIKGISRIVTVAASIALVIGIGCWIWFNTRTVEVKPVTVVAHDVSAPEVTKATLKFADGKIMYLDSAASGLLAVQDNIKVVKLDDGRILYQLSRPVASTTTQFNTITNPRGSKVISLKLADGTQIWLNAESSITYPIAFTGNERRLKITGEAYFKVEHNDKFPFIVSINNIEVTDLGTEFNIKAYGDETEIQTTLIEGSARVSRNNSTTVERESITLKPGEQVVAVEQSPLTSNRPEMLDEITAWKEGLFHFENAGLAVILKEFARWYDIDVEYSGQIPADKYFLIFKRSSSLSTVLEALRASGIKFQIENKKLRVQPG